MNYGTLKLDTLVYTSGGFDSTVTVSGLANGASGVFPSGTAAATAITVGSSGNGLYSPGTNQVAISTSGVGRLFIDGTGQIETASLGTAAAPVYTFVDDPNTGIYSPGADQVAISTNGTGRLFVNSSGSVGIGTSSVTAGVKLQVADGTASKAQFNVTGYGGLVLGQNADLSSEIDQTSSGANLFIKHGGTAAITVDTSRRVGIGTTTPGKALDVAVGSSSALRISRAGVSEGDFSIDASGNVVYDSGIGDGHIFRVDGGVERLRIDSSGRLLVGTSSARSIAGGLTSAVQIEAATDFNKAALSLVNNSNDSSGSYLALGKSRAGALGGNTIVQNGDLYGDIRFAGADGTDLETISARIAAEVDGTPGANDMPGRLVFSTTADGASSPTQRMVIKSTGLVGIGIADPTNSFANGNGVQFDPVGVVYANRSSAPSASFGRNTSTGDVLGFFYGSTATNASQVGSISVTASATAYNTSSDYRLKENVVAVTDGIARLQQLKPSRFNFISDPDTTVDGFIAHEVQAIVPEAIRGVKDEVDAEGNPVYQGIDQSKLVPLLTAALQEAVAKIESLEARLTAAGI